MAGYNIVEHADFVETVIYRGVEWTKRSTTLQLMIMITNFFR